MNRVEYRALDAARLVEDADEGIGGVCRARCVRGDGHASSWRAEFFFIGAYQYRLDASPLARGGDYDALGTGIEVRLSLFSVGKESCRFDDDIDLHVAPRELPWLALRKYRYVPATDNKRRSFGSDIELRFAVDRVVFEEICEIQRGREVIDGHHLEPAILPLMQVAEEATPYSAEAIDSDPRHPTILYYGRDHCLCTSSYREIVSPDILCLMELYHCLNRGVERRQIFMD